MIYFPTESIFRRTGALQRVKRESGALLIPNMITSSLWILLRITASSSAPRSAATRRSDSLYRTKISHSFGCDNVLH